jgi:hypothetical protein
VDAPYFIFCGIWHILNGRKKNTLGVGMFHLKRLSLIWPYLVVSTNKQLGVGTFCLKRRSAIRPFLPKSLDLACIWLYLLKLAVRMNGQKVDL